MFLYLDTVCTGPLLLFQELFLACLPEE